MATTYRVETYLSKQITVEHFSTMFEALQFALDIVSSAPNQGYVAILELLPDKSTEYNPVYDTILHVMPDRSICHCL